MSDITHKEDENMANVLVIGASGQIGKQATVKLLDAERATEWLGARSRNLSPVLMLVPWVAL